MTSSIDAPACASRFRTVGPATTRDLAELQERFLAQLVVDFLGLVEITRSSKPELLRAPVQLDVLSEFAFEFWDDFLAVAGEPDFCFWLQTWQDIACAHSNRRVAQNDIGLVIAAEGSSASEFEATHVPDLGAFVSAAACRAGGTLALPGALAIPGGMLPGRDMEFVTGPCPLLLGVSDGLPRWAEPREEVAVPVASVNHWKLRVHAHGRAYHLRHVERWTRLVDRDIRLIAARHIEAGMQCLADTLDGFCENAGMVTRICVPMTTAGVTPMASGSYTRMQGAVFIADCPDPELTAEMLIHEVSHTRLSLLESLSPLFGPRSRTELCHYSPWRDTLRSAEGVLHALFVHIEIATFWHRRLHMGTDEQSRRGLCRLWTLCRQLEVGSRDLRRTGEFTEVGRILLDRIDADREIIERDLPKCRSDAKPFFSEIKGDSSLAELAIPDAIMAHRKSVTSLRECEP